MDETYMRMKKSADRIAAVLGIQKPNLEDAPSCSGGHYQQALRSKSPPKQCMASRPGTQFASVSFECIINYLVDDGSLELDRLEGEIESSEAGKAQQQHRRALSIVLN